MDLSENHLKSNWSPLGEMLISASQIAQLIYQIITHDGRGYLQRKTVFQLVHCTDF